MNTIQRDLEHPLMLQTQVKLLLAICPVVRTTPLSISSTGIRQSLLNNLKYNDIYNKYIIKIKSFNTNNDLHYKYLSVTGVNQSTRGQHIYFTSFQIQSAQQILVCVHTTTYLWNMDYKLAHRKEQFSLVKASMTILMIIVYRMSWLMAKGNTYYV